MGLKQPLPLFRCGLELGLSILSSSPLNPANGWKRGSQEGFSGRGEDLKTPQSKQNRNAQQAELSSCRSVPSRPLSGSPGLHSSFQGTSPISSLESGRVPPFASIFLLPWARTPATHRFSKRGPRPAAPMLPGNK